MQGWCPLPDNDVDHNQQVRWDIAFDMAKAARNVFWTSIRNVRMQYNTDTSTSSNHMIDKLSEQYVAILNEYGISVDISERSYNVAFGYAIQHDRLLSNTWEASSVIFLVWTHAKFHYNDCSEIEQEILSGITERGLTINDDDLHRISSYIYSDWHSELAGKNKIRDSEQITLLRARGKSPTEIGADLQARRSEYGLPELSQEQLQQKVAMIIKMRDHPGLAIAGHLKEMAHGIIDVVNVLRQSGKST